jgi:hypothetical protein
MAKRRRRKSAAPKAPRRKRASSRRSSARRTAPRVTLVHVQNPSRGRRRRRSSARRASSTRRRPLRRRRNDGGRITWKDGLIAVLAGAGAIGLVTMAVEKEIIPASALDKPWKQGATNIAIAGAGAYAAYKVTKSPAAALGIAAGLGGLGLYGAVTNAQAQADEPAPALDASISGNTPQLGAVEVGRGNYMGAVEVGMGAVEVGMGAVYDRYDSAPIYGGMVAR